MAARSNSNRSSDQNPDLNRPSGVGKYRDFPRSRTDNTGEKGSHEADPGKRDLNIETVAKFSDARERLGVDREFMTATEAKAMREQLQEEMERQIGRLREDYKSGQGETDSPNAEMLRKLTPGVAVGSVDNQRFHENERSDSFHKRNIEAAGLLLACYPLFDGPTKGWCDELKPLIEAVAGIRGYNKAKMHEVLANLTSNHGKDSIYGSKGLYQVLMAFRRVLNVCPQLKKAGERGFDLRMLSVKQIKLMVGNERYALLVVDKSVGDNRVTARRRVKKPASTPSGAKSPHRESRRRTPDTPPAEEERPSPPPEIIVPPKASEDALSVGAEDVEEVKEPSVDLIAGVKKKLETAKKAEEAEKFNEAAREYIDIAKAYLTYAEGLQKYAISLVDVKKSMEQFELAAEQYELAAKYYKSALKSRKKASATPNDAELSDLQKKVESCGSLAKTSRTNAEIMKLIPDDLTMIKEIAEKIDSGGLEKEEMVETSTYLDELLKNLGKKSGVDVLSGILYDDVIKPALARVAELKKSGKTYEEVMDSMMEDPVFNTLNKAFSKSGDKERIWIDLYSLVFSLRLEIAYFMEEGE